MRSMASTIRPVSTRRLEEAEPRWGGQLFGQGAARVRSKPEPICVWIGVCVCACVSEACARVCVWEYRHGHLLNLTWKVSLNQDDFF